MINMPSLPPSATPPPAICLGTCNYASDADCDAYVCPVTVDREGIIPTLGCGCISYRCADGVFEDHYSWHKPEKYHCGVMFDY